MKSVLGVLMVVVLASPVSAQPPLQLPTSPEDVPAYCQKREIQPTTLAVMGRDRGIPMQQFLDAIPVGQIGFFASQELTNRLQDVYDNPGLTALTLSVFRSASCVEEIARRAPPQYKPQVRPALLQCQSDSGGSLKDLAACVADASDANILR